MIRWLRQLFRIESSVAKSREHYTAFVEAFVRPEQRQRWLEDEVFSGEGCTELLEMFDDLDHLQWRELSEEELFGGENLERLLGVGDCAAIYEAPYGVEVGMTPRSGYSHANIMCCAGIVSIEKGGVAMFITPTNEAYVPITVQPT